MSVKPGALRFNTDSMKLEIFRGSANYEGSASMAGIGTLAAGQWEEIQATSPDVQTGGTRALFGGGTVPSVSDIIDYINLDTTGDAIDFGNLLSATQYVSGVASRTRGVFGGGDTDPAYIDVIQYVTIASTGNTQDFGDLTDARHYAAGVSNGTRGIFAGGEQPASRNIIDFVTIASTGDAVDFGDLGGVRYGQAPANSKTRAVFSGGSPNTENQDFITMSTQGDSAKFGDLAGGTREQLMGASNSVRGLVMGGNDPAAVNVVEYFTIATLGSSADYGDLTQARKYGTGAASSTRVCAAGGVAQPSAPSTSITTIDYTQVMSLGDFIDFGDLTSGRWGLTSGLSNGHGGL